MAGTKKEKRKPQKPKQKKNWKALLMSLSIGVAIGLMLVAWVFPMDTFGGYWIALSVFVLTMLLAVPLHEAGHLVFGLLTGYRLQSFALYRWQIVHTREGKWKIAPWVLPGAMGQCVMCPPEWPQDGKLPFVAYNLGGGLATAIVGAVLLALAIPRYGTMGGLLLWSAFLMMLLMTLTNLLPMSMQINNDGMNIRLLRKSERTRRAFWVQMQVAARNQAGQPLREMPEEWFQLENAPENVLESEVPWMQMYRTLEMRDYAETKALCHALLSRNTCILPLRRIMTVAIGAVCELLTDEKGVCLKEYVTEEFQKTAMAVSALPLLQIAVYGVHLLHDRDAEKAAAAKKRAEKTLSHYQLPLADEPERTLMQDIAAKDAQMENAAAKQGKEQNS